MDIPLAQELLEIPNLTYDDAPAGTASVGQEYRTPDKLIYITFDFALSDSFPPGKLGLSFFHHSIPIYQAALSAARFLIELHERAPARRSVDVSAMIHPMLARFRTHGGLAWTLPSREPLPT